MTAAPEIIDIEQPTRITESGHWFFLKGHAHFGAEYGIYLTPEEVAERFAAKVGPGQLVQSEDRWFWVKS